MVDVASATTSPRTMDVLFQSARASVDENTYFFIAFTLLPHEHRWQARRLRHDPRSGHDAEEPPRPRLLGDVRQRECLDRE